MIYRFICFCRHHFSAQMIIVSQKKWFALFYHKVITFSSLSIWYNRYFGFNECHMWNSDRWPFRSTRVHPRFFLFCVVFCRSLFVLFCILCPTVIYSFLLSLLFLRILLLFCVMFCKSLFVLLRSLFFCPLYCLPLASISLCDIAVSTSSLSKYYWTSNTSPFLGITLIQTNVYLVLYLVFCRSLFVLFFFFWKFHCVLITPLVSLSFSCESLRCSQRVVILYLYVLLF